TDGTSGCTGTNSITIGTGTAPNINISPASDSICSGSTKTLTATGGTTYNWQPGNTSGSTLVVSTANTYTVTGTTNGCSATATSTIKVSASVALNAGKDTSICPGGAIKLHVTGAPAGSIYTWNPFSFLT